MKLIVRIFELCGWMPAIPAIQIQISIRNEFWYRIWYRKRTMVSRYQKVRDTCDTKSIRNGLMQVDELGELLSNIISVTHSGHWLWTSIRFPIPIDVDCVSINYN